jgi:hypothetical protein
MPRTEYRVAGASHNSFAAHLDNAIPPVVRSNDLLSHAKLFCFAMQHMIDPLQEACLHILQRDMVVFDILNGTVGYVIDLIKFTYDNTAATDTAEDDSESESEAKLDYTGGTLRKLVLQFALARKSELRELKEFKDLISQSGDFVVNFVDGLQ